MVMKISSIKHDILIVVVIFMLIESVSIFSYQKLVLGSNEKDEINTQNIIDKTIVDLTGDEAETLELINEYRKKNGLTDLKPIKSLQDVSKLKAEDLVNYEYFSHTSPNLGTPFEMLKNNGIYYKVAGENLAGNTTPQRAVEAWINSESHRDNILDGRFQYTGVYVIDSEVYGKVFVQIFMGV